MRHISEYRDPKIIQNLLSAIRTESNSQIRLMEVCGTHTVAIFRSGIKDALPDNISLISGPGCPVCITPNHDIDLAIEIAKSNDAILTTFGDMIRVAGSYSSLEKERAEGADIRVVYSSLDALDIARQNPNKMIVLFGIGFETTSPTIAGSIISAKKENIKNFCVLSTHKTIPPAMKLLLEAGEVKINGFICPGHVSTIIGSQAYEFITRDYNVPCVIAGFEPIDILQSVLMLVRQINNGQAKVEIGYRRAVRPEGNIKAQEIINEVFDTSDTRWRGLGIVPQSGLAIKEKYRQFNACHVFDISIQSKDDPKGCLCGEVLRGLNTPYDCVFFGKVCTPETPIGPCMVSSEGTCSAYYKYGKRNV